MRRRRGLTLVELVVSVSLFSLVGLLIAGAFTLAADVWRRTSASTDSRLALSKGRDDIVRDLEATSFSSVRVASGPSSLGPNDGDAIWFLSAVDPASGEFMRKSDGTPFWQRTILYYAVVPGNHAGLFGFTCTGGADGDGYDAQCPHKVLLRKVIDGGSATDPTDVTTEEKPLTASEISNYLTQPVGYGTGGMSGESGVSEVSLPSTNLLSFKARLAPDPEWQREVRLELSAVSILSASREVKIGSTLLDGSRFASELVVSVFPGIP